MIPTIIIVGLAWYWLLKETNYLRIRLLVGAEALIIPKTWEWMICSSKQHEAAWKSAKLPAKTIHFHGSTLNLNAGCNWCRAKLLRDIHIAHTTNRPIRGLSTRTMPAMFNPNPGGGRPQFDFGKWRPKTKYFEPEIEILVNGESKGKFNGNYKRGMIKQAMKV